MLYALLFKICPHVLWDIFTPIFQPQSLWFSAKYIGHSSNTCLQHSHGFGYGCLRFHLGLIPKLDPSTLWWFGPCIEHGPEVLKEMIRNYRSRSFLWEGGLSLPPTSSSPPCCLCWSHAMMMPLLHLEKPLLPWALLQLIFHNNVLQRFELWRFFRYSKRWKRRHWNANLWPQHCVNILMNSMSKNLGLSVLNFYFLLSLYS